jgi:hypothetical protein
MAVLNPELTVEMFQTQLRIIAQFRTETRRTARLHTNTNINTNIHTSASSAATTMTENKTWVPPHVVKWPRPLKPISRPHYSLPHSVASSIASVLNEPPSSTFPVDSPNSPPITHSLFQHSY